MNHSYRYIGRAISIEAQSVVFVFPKRVGPEGGVAVV